MNKARTHFNNSLGYYEIGEFIKNYIMKDTIIVCIGTDRCIGDCLGPLVGTLLKDKSFPLPVFGTISDPIHALNLDRKLYEISLLHPSANIIGIDACLGDEDNVGEIQARDYPIHPGKGVGKTLPLVGKSSIIGIVDSTDANVFNNNNIRLSLIFNMAKVICDALFHAYHLSSSTLSDIKDCLL
ncbi:spore protease YyaC [Clostridium sp. HMP27]|uniref:spore protease YyaC n=1 Tax=Clostridium sp. HMP27 TaxID=1487921 RepID=UPI00052B54C8|nr:spore protease YyaC [Clostridium sp. HMP27]KGK90712.1 sporulation protein [Clostridium sp. HMP27]